jgi:hypothetical protein
MYKLTQAPQSRKVTPKDCEYFLSLNNFPGQRTMNPLKVKSYGDIHRQGGFRPFNISVATAPNGQKYLVNGQHCCQMVQQTGKDCSATIEYFKCETDRDLWMLFGSFDVHATRSQSQIFKGARGLLASEELRELPLRHLSHCGAAISMMQGDAMSHIAKMSNKTDKVRFVDENPGFVSWAAAFHDTPFIATVGVLCAMFATYRVNKPESDKFWHQVKDGVNLKSKQDPIYRLREQLRSGCQTNMSSGSRFTFEYAVCVSWWNSYRSGDDRRIVKVAAMKEMPIALK